MSRKPLLMLVAGAQANSAFADSFAAEWTRQGGGVIKTLNLLDLEWPLFHPLKFKQHDMSFVEPTFFLFEAHSKMAFFSPEYNGGTPPVWSNTLAWLSCFPKTDWRKAFKGKQVIIGTHSGGNGERFLKAARLQLAHIGMEVLAEDLNYASPHKSADIEKVVSLLMNSP